MRTKLRALLVVAVLAACGDGTIDPGTYMVRDSAGVRIIESSAAAWMPSRIIESEPLLRIGREEEGPYQFAFLVGGLLVEDGGNLAVEASAQEVRASSTPRGDTPGPSAVRERAPASSAASVPCSRTPPTRLPCTTVVFGEPRCSTDMREGDAAVPSYRRRYEETSHFAERVPLFGIACVDRGQPLWVSGPGWSDAEAGLREWTVFSPEGSLLGELEAPPRLRIVDSRDDLVLGIWTDELDVPHIQVHRIVASGSM